MDQEAWVQKFPRMFCLEMAALTLLTTLDRLGAVPLIGARMPKLTEMEYLSLWLMGADKVNSTDRWEKITGGVG